jgi:hypothetical protein
MIEKIRKIGKKNIFFNGKMIKRTVYQDPYNGNIWIESKDGGIHYVKWVGDCYEPTGHGRGKR